MQGQNRAMDDTTDHIHNTAWPKEGLKITYSNPFILKKNLFETQRVYIILQNSHS